MKKKLDSLFYLNDDHQKMIKNDKIKYLKLFDFNREAGVRRSLVNSINKNGVVTTLTLVKTDLISGEEHYYIADGQNRAKAITCTDKDAPVFVVNTKFKTIGEIVNFVSLLNSSQVAWKCEDYINAYALMQLPDYKFLNSFKNKTAWTLPTIAKIFGSSISNSAVKTKLVEGTYSIVRKEEGLKVLEFANELNKFHLMSSRMLISLSNMMKLNEFDGDHFKSEYIKNIKDVTLMDLNTFDDVFIKWIKK